MRISKKHAFTSTLLLLFGIPGTLPSPFYLNSVEIKRSDVLGRYYPVYEYFLPIRRHVELLGENVYSLPLDPHACIMKQKKEYESWVDLPDGSKFCYAVRNYENRILFIREVKGLDMELIALNVGGEYNNGRVRLRLLAVQGRGTPSGADDTAILEIVPISN